MRLSRTQTGLALMIAGACALSSGCKRKSNEEKPTETASNSAESASTLTLDEQRSVDALAETVDRQKWTFVEPLPPDQAVELAVLIAKVHEENAVVGAALGVLAGALQSGAAMSDPVESVLLKHLNSKEPRVAAIALAAATPALGGAQPNERLLAAVIALADEDEFRAGKGRYAVLESVRRASHTVRKQRLKNVFLSSLDAPEHYVVVAALQALDNEKLPVRGDPELQKASFPLLQHHEPAVRGMAAHMLGRVGKESERAQSALIDLLKDDNAFVRSQAATALGAVGKAPAVHALIGLVDDHADNRMQYFAATFERDSLLKALNSSYWPHVSDAAQVAVMRVAPGAPRIEPPKPADVLGSLKQNAKTLRAWYEKNKGSIPRDSGSQAQTAKPASPRSTLPASANTP